MCLFPGRMNYCMLKINVPSLEKVTLDLPNMDWPPRLKISISQNSDWTGFGDDKVATDLNCQFKWKLQYTECNDKQLIHVVVIEFLTFGCLYFSRMAFRVLPLVFICKSCSKRTVVFRSDALYVVQCSKVEFCKTFQELFCGCIQLQKKMTGSRCKKVAYPWVVRLIKCPSGQKYS